MVKCKCNKKNCKITYNKADLKIHLKQNAAGAKAQDMNRDKEKVMPHYIGKKSPSKIALLTGLSVERVSRCIRKIDNLKKKKSRREECRECFEKSKSEYEATSITGLTPAKVKKYYNKFKKEQGLDILPPQSPSNSTNMIISINGETLFPIMCKKCDQMKKLKLFVVKRDANKPTIIGSGFSLEAERCPDCDEMIDVKFISDRVY